MGDFGRSLLSIAMVLATYSAICGAWRLKEGDLCSSNDGETGVCATTGNCLRALQTLFIGFVPKICCFRGFMPILCCPLSKEQLKEPMPASEPYDDPMTTTVRSRATGEVSTRWCDYYKSACTVKINVRNLQQNTMSDVGSEDATENEFPHMAAVGYGHQNNIKWGCGGSLISEYFVLTAAHCLHDETRGPVRWIRLGSGFVHDEIREGWNNKGQTHPVIDRIRHPKYKWPSKYHDLALLKIGPALEENAVSTLSNTIHPACLQVSEKKMYKGTATEWTRLGHGEKLTPNLQKITLDILDNSECNRTYDLEISRTTKLQRGIDESMICAGLYRGERNTCKGDSGGLLQSINHHGSCLHQIIGVTSFGNICGFKNSPIVYTRVSPLLDWIEEHVWPEP